MAVAVGGQSGVFEPGTIHEALFTVPSTGNTDRYTYQASKDGQRFLVSVPLAGVAPPITVVLNWRAGVRR
jgi:hypothetical protein